MYENACRDSSWVERPTSGALPGGMNAEAYGSSDDGMETTPIFVTMTSFGMGLGGVQACRVGGMQWNSSRSPTATLRSP